MLGTTMDVEIEEVISKNNDNNHALITSSKAKAVFTVQKAHNGYALWEVVRSSGTTPKVLRGQYTSMNAGIKSVVDYLKNAKMTQGAKREILAARRKRNADA